MSGCPQKAFIFDLISGNKSNTFGSRSFLEYPCGFGKVSFFQTNICQRHMVFSLQTYDIPRLQINSIASSQHFCQVHAFIYCIAFSKAFHRFRHCVKICCCCLTSKGSCPFFIIVGTFLLFHDVLQ